MRWFGVFVISVQAQQIESHNRRSGPEILSCEVLPKARRYMKVIVIILTAVAVSIEPEEGKIPRTSSLTFNRWPVP